MQTTETMTTGRRLCPHGGQDGHERHHLEPGHLCSRELVPALRAGLAAEAPHLRCTVEQRGETIHVKAVQS